jgi:hypothetical protein
MTRRRLRWITRIALALLVASFLVGYLQIRRSSQHYYRWRSTSFWRREVREWVASKRLNSSTSWAPSWLDRILSSIDKRGGMLQPAVLEGEPDALPVLLDLLNDDEESVRALVCSTLARMHNWPISGLQFFVVDAAVFRLGPNEGGAFLVAAETIPSFGLSAELPAEHVYLLDSGGHLLDRVTCASCPFGFGAMAGHCFQAQVCENPETDGAQVIVRNSPGTGCTSPILITYGHDVEAFCWGGDSLQSIEPAVWRKKGLCRLAIRDGKFKVLFPVPKPR